MIIIRPHDSDWQAIRDATGDPSWAPPEMNPYFARVERCLYRDGPTGGHGQAGWLPTRWPDVLRLAGDAIDHRDLSIGRIALEAATANPVKLPIGLGDAPTLEDLAKAKVDPNDLRVLERHGTGLIVVPMAIDRDGRRTLVQLGRLYQSRTDWAGASCSRHWSTRRVPVNDSRSGSRPRRPAASVITWRVTRCARNRP